MFLSRLLIAALAALTLSTWLADSAEAQTRPYVIGNGVFFESPTYYVVPPFPTAGLEPPVTVTPVPVVSRIVVEHPIGYFGYTGDPMDAPMFGYFRTPIHVRAAYGQAIGGPYEVYYREMTRNYHYPHSKSLHYYHHYNVLHHPK